MAVALHNSLFLVIAQVLGRLPTLADLVRAMNRNESLRDGSRFF
jgi:hypothetical protein